MDADVIVVGAGPVGLMLTAELGLHGVRVLVLDSLPAPSPHSRAFGLNARSTETMELRGLLPRLEAEVARVPMFGGVSPTFRAGVPRAHFAGIRTIRLDTLEAGRPGMFSIAQTGVEAVLGARAAELGAVVRRGVTVTGLDQDGEGVTVSAAGESLRAAYVVGCDGGRSTVRKLAGFAFPGSPPTITGRLAEVAVPDLHADPGMGWHRCPGGMLQVLPGRVLAVEFDGPPADRDEPVTVAEMSSCLSRIVGRPITIPGEPGWMTRFTDNTRLADDYRRGRVLLAGDAAHVHSPFGGQGLNLGLQDAANLGWKLAATVCGRAPYGLLDTYAAERRPVAGRVLHNTRAQVRLMNPDPVATPLYELFASLMELEQVNRYLAEMLSAVDVRYDLGGDDGMAGRFVPDLTLDTGAGVRDLFACGRAVLLDLTDDAAVRRTAAGWADRLDVVTARPEGAVTGPLLVRPDGYVAWAGTGELRHALERWLGDADRLARPVAHSARR
ncbi:FAD-dependent monooxygenase [Actinoallomurus sp. CA-142502]|uniref:FAD-dependent monooxygenase n=1 Tax=Actinoallomurus sp. CA-142502 TaxID=3239885 RepID=UPI003D94B714